MKDHHTCMEFVLAVQKQSHRQRHAKLLRLNGLLMVCNAITYIRWNSSDKHNLARTTSEGSSYGVPSPNPHFHPPRCYASKLNNTPDLVTPKPSKKFKRQPHVRDPAKETWFPETRKCDSQPHRDILHYSLPQSLCHININA